MDMSIYNHTMLPLGTTNRRREGDYVVVYEVVGWNDKAKCNKWAEKSKKYSPASTVSINDLVEAERRSRDWDYTIQLHNRVKKED